MVKLFKLHEYVMFYCICVALRLYWYSWKGCHFFGPPGSVSVFTFCSSWTNCYERMISLQFFLYDIASIVWQYTGRCWQSVI